MSDDRRPKDDSVVAAIRNGFNHYAEAEACGQLVSDESYYIEQHVKSYILELKEQLANERKDLIKQIMGLQTRLDEIIKYCEPHQKYMWAKYITGFAKEKEDWRDND